MLFFLTQKWILSERKREEWEMNNYPEGEIREMIDIYESRGMSPQDAKLVIETMAKYKDFFVDVMMQQELELQASSYHRAIMSCEYVHFLANIVLLPHDRYQMKIMFRRAVVKVGFNHVASDLIVVFCHSSCNERVYIFHVFIFQALSCFAPLQHSERCLC